MAVGNLPSNDLAFLKAEDKSPKEFALLPETTFPENNSSELEVEDASFAMALTNPVKPITRKLSEVIKKPIEFAKGKNEETQRKGFFIKIGKFELYSNRKDAGTSGK